jgi:hypothetical protein
MQERKGACTRFGDADRADLTFSVAKTYLALLAGVAHQQGLLPDVHEPVSARLSGIGFDDEHNARRDLASPVAANQRMDRRMLWHSGSGGPLPATGVCTTRQRHQGRQAARCITPGSYWEYNDVRINQLSLALLHLFRRPLPEVFAEFIAGPAGASSDWAWRGYDNAWVEIDGKKHAIGARRHALGRWYIDQRKRSGEDRSDSFGPGGCKWQANSSRRVDRYNARTLPDCPFYGYLVWLNDARRIFPSVPETSFFALGAGGNYTFIQPEAELCVVVRWLDDATCRQLLCTRARRRCLTPDQPIKVAGRTPGPHQPLPVSARSLPCKGKTGKLSCAQPCACRREPAWPCAHRTHLPNVPSRWLAPWQTQQLFCHDWTMPHHALRRPCARTVTRRCVIKVLAAAFDR